MNLPPPWSPFLNRLRRRLGNRWFLAVLVALVLYTLGGFLLAPYVLERRAETWATETLDCRLDLDRIHINPYTLTLDVTGLALREPGGPPILSFQRLFANLQISSLVHRAWTFAEIQLEGPHLHVDVPPEGHPNLVRLMRKAGGLPDDSVRTESEAEPLGLVFERIRISHGRLSLSDRSGSTPAEASIHPIHLDVRDLSTRTEQKGPHTLEAALPSGGTLTWTGRASLSPLASHGSIVLERLRPAAAWPFFRDVLHVQEPGGSIDVEANYRFGLTPRGPELVVDPFRIIARGLAVPLPEDETPSLRFEEVSVDAGRFDLATASLTLASVRLERGRVVLRLDEQGRLNWQDVAAGALEPGPAEPSAKVRSGASPFHVQIDALEAKEIGVRLEDQSRAEPVSVEMTHVDLGLSARLERQGSSLQALLKDIRVDGTEGTVAVAGSKDPLLRLAEMSARGGRFDLAERALNLETIRLARGRAVLVVNEEGQVSGLGPAAVPEASKPASSREPSSSVDLPFRATVENLSLEDIGVRLVDRSREEPLSLEMDRVSVGLSARAEWKGSSLQAVADAVQIHGTGGTIRSPLSHEPLLLVAETSLRGGRFDLAEHLVGIEELRITGTRADVSRNEDGTLNWSRLLQPSPEQPASPKDPGAEASAAAEQSPWSLDMASFHLDFALIRLRDLKAGAEPLYHLENFRLDIQDAHIGSNKPFSFELSLEAKPEGNIRAGGTAALGKPRLEADMEAETLALTPLQPYLASFARVDLASGNVSAWGRIRYGGSDSEAPLFSGEMNLSDLLVTRSGSEERLLAWKDAQALGVTWRPRPNGLAIDEVVFTEPAMDLVIQEDKGLGLRDLLVSTNGKEASSSAESRKTGKGPFPVEIKQVGLENGLMDFADQSMTPGFSATIHELGGTINGLSSQPGRHAGLALDGRVDEYGSTRIQGSIELFDPKDFTEIVLHFHNVDLSHLSPYATRFAGYRIESGKLSLDLDYAIRDSRLQGKNRIVLDHLILGERVENPDALDLRLELAVALLQDKNGRIDIGLPISGDLKHPEFSFGHIVRQALGNFLNKVVTAPFRALGGLLGGGAEDLDAVGFNPGRADLPLSETEKLLKLSEALQARPRLAVEVRAAYAPEADGAALRRAALRRDLAERRGVILADGEAPPPVVYTDPPTQKALSALAAERLPREAVNALRREYSVQQGAESAVDSLEFFRVLFERLAEAMPIQEGALKGLARLRANAVVRQLLTAGGLDHARAAMAEEVSETEAQHGRVPCRLEMKAAE